MLHPAEQRAGWQSGGGKCGPRDWRLGWHRSVQFRRLHLIGNNTRFLVLPEALGIANLASQVLHFMMRREDALDAILSPIRATFGLAIPCVSPLAIR